MIELAEVAESCWKNAYWDSSSVCCSKNRQNIFSTYLSELTVSSKENLFSYASICIHTTLYTTWRIM